MRRFSEFGIDPFKGRKMFMVPKVSIEDVMGHEIEVLDFEADIHTSQGDDRYLIKIRMDGKECKFFTTSRYIKSQLTDIPQDGLPFMATIRKQRIGKGYMYYFE